MGILYGEVNRGNAQKGTLGTAGLSLAAVGIVFGDILVNEFGLHWVSYEDDIGTSKALRWRETENYVFPVTLFSKRVGFNEKIDVVSVFAVFFFCARAQL